MNSHFKLISTKTTEFDTGNPRIKKALEKYGDNITAERISFALRTASEDAKAATSFSRLKDSIRAIGSITQPITVVIQNDETICIDGNTRLSIYKEFLGEETDGDWTKIPALVLSNANQKDIETIRVSAHLVGTRAWPAYEKARYLHYLYHQEFMEFGDMVVRCGGNKKEIERQIEAYENMNMYYRDVVDDTAFHIDRFSGFVELQKPGIKEVILDSGYELSTFGEWIRDGKIRRLADVRLLPKVLKDDEATEIFTGGGIGSIEIAAKYVDNKIETDANLNPRNITLEKASIHLLAQFLARKISELPFSALQALNDGKDDHELETIRACEDLQERLGELLSHVGK